MELTLALVLKYARRCDVIVGVVSLTRLWRGSWPDDRTSTTTGILKNSSGGFFVETFNQIADRIHAWPPALAQIGAVIVFGDVLPRQVENVRVASTASQYQRSNQWEQPYLHRPRSVDAQAGCV